MVLCNSVLATIYEIQIQYNSECKYRKFFINMSKKKKKKFNSNIFRSKLL